MYGFRTWCTKTLHDSGGTLLGVAKDDKIKAAQIGTLPEGWLDMKTKEEPTR
ncbi:MAG: hypothetical protein JRJ87_09820 [Deltaproteobacteria bacterium]|nr:hypothetical protein [Deltaproteobacteria bacterium]